MTDEEAATKVCVAVDNDVIKKILCYGIAALVWADHSRVGVLGAARYVVGDAISRGQLNRDEPSVLREFDAFIGASNVFEPTERELALAAELETFAQREGLALDPGESQLAAATIEREIKLLQTGDKRAIAAFEQTLDAIAGAASLAGKIQCLEQIMLELVTASAQAAVAAAVCAEPTIDKTLTICFACASGGTTIDGVVQGLQSYVKALRDAAPRVLVA